MPSAHSRTKSTRSSARTSTRSREGELEEDDAGRPAKKVASAEPTSSPAPDDEEVFGGNLKDENLDGLEEEVG